MSKARDLANSVRRSAFTPTGVYLPYALSTAPDGWLFMDGRTIGSATSGATSRANADCYDLYIGLWTSMSNTEAPVTGGRGASAIADWNANKPIAIPDHRGRVPAGKDNMGGTAANRLTSAASGINGAVLGAAGGADSHVLSAAQMPSHSHTPTFTDGNGFGLNAGGTNRRLPFTSDASGVDIGTTVAGSSLAHPNAQPTFVANMIIKL